MNKLGLFSLLSIIASSALAAAPGSLNQPSPWTLETGLRFWVSRGTLGAPQPLLNSPPTTLASRLTYVDLDAYSSEFFARLDHQRGFFVKGYAGAGAITNGRLYDEDFPAGPVYSKTRSATSGYLSYATIDVGHSLIKQTNNQFGAFLGYNYYAQHLTATGCAQVAGSTICEPGQIPSNYPGIAEDDHFNALRLGLATQFKVSEHLTWSSEAAYLPLVGFEGQDDHNARALMIPESATVGNGVMLEALMSYRLSDHWNLGLGGRYWAFNMRKGSVNFKFLNAPEDTTEEPARFNAQRFGVFLESRYHWDERLPAVFQTEGLHSFRGLSLGAYLGGSWSQDHWSDPFPSTPGTTPTNVAGFGDSISASGPLGGILLSLHAQRGSLVFGVATELAQTGIRGENTCFSGLGGLNCERQLNSFGSLTAEVGPRFNHTRLYLKGGPAFTNTTYEVDGNTNALTLNAQKINLHAFGWLAGLGLEQALTEQWLTFVEYNYLEVPTRTIRFPAVAIVNTETLRVRQTLNFFKLGLRYQFDL